ncbi:MAG TPA: ABC transporter permease [Gemmatimonadaceae bacterium]|nr:ABC transporter permease [Gemmatimonadaceae bacterium]
MSSIAPSIRDWRADAAAPAGGRRPLVLPLALLTALVVAAAAAPLLSAHGPEAIDLAGRRAAPSAAHWLGTDELGRDLLARVLYGARVSLAVGLLSALLAGALGTAVGAAAGYLGGRWDALLMRVTDAVLAVPRLPLAMVLGAILAPSVATLIVLLGLVGWMETARVVRAEVASLRAREFVEAARAAGAGHGRVVVRHLLPNAAPAVAVATTLAAGRAILLESALSFFGVGVQPPTASWGSMLYQAQGAMATEPWLAVFPGAAIFGTVLVVNAVGEGLAERDGA